MEIGVQSFARTPTEWLSLISRYDELCRASGFPPAYILGRVKQWLRMNNFDGTLTWFDALKGCQTLGELLTNLGRLAAFPPINSGLLLPAVSQGHSAPSP